MLKKIYNTIFAIAFLAILALPLIMTDYTSGGVSEDENRTLAYFPAVTVEGKWNETFTGEFETWFMDHLGLRQEMITANAAVQFYGFDRLISKSDYHIGPDGDLNYADEEMLLDYVHLNLRSEYWLWEMGRAYQYFRDVVTEQGAEFYYVQCYDKHSVYPEQFRDDVLQLGDVSKTEQMVAYLQEKTTVNTISLKEPLLLAKDAGYEVYSNWGDPTHWSPRGAFVGYQYVMEQINAGREQPFRVLQESDYDIEIKEGGITLNKVIHRDDYYEHFTVRNPQAQEVDNAVMGQWAKEGHFVWENPNAGNDSKLLLLCDSYFNGYIGADFAESFSQVWLIHADNNKDIREIMDLYQPDIVVFECAERVDRSGQLYNFFMRG